MTRAYRQRAFPALTYLVPISFPHAFRMLIVLLMAVHALCMYCLARAECGTFGFHAGTTFRAAAFALAMMLPLAWAAGIPELPEALGRFRRHRRWRQGRCSGCGYPVAAGQSIACPECAQPLEEPARYELTWATVRRFALLVTAAWLLGTATGEWSSRDDERRFVQEVQARIAAGEPDLYVRPRRWPAFGELRYPFPEDAEP